MRRGRSLYDVSRIMARWFLQSEDKSDEERVMAHVDLLPQMSSYEESTHQQNPADHPQKGAIGGSGGYNPQYWHYCTALYRWNDIDPSKLSQELGKSPDHIHSTKRFGDMGGYYMPKNGFHDLGFVERPNSVFSKYRFNISDCVPYAQYGSRGGLGGNPVDPFSANGRNSVTCGWIPNDTRNNSWRPSAGDISKMVIDIGSNLADNGSSLSALKNKTDQKWNAAVVAWFHAGYQRKKKDKDTGAVIKPYKGAKNRSVSACDVYFFGYLY